MDPDIVFREDVFMSIWGVEATLIILYGLFTLLMFRQGLRNGKNKFRGKLITKENYHETVIEIVAVTFMCALFSPVITLFGIAIGIIAAPFCLAVLFCKPPEKNYLK